MSESVGLRPVEPSDDEFLLVLYGSTRDAELALTGWDDAQRAAFLQLQFRAQRTDYEARFPNAKHSVVVVDGSPVGRIWIDRRADEIRLLDIALLTSSRRAGVGAELLRRLIDEASTAGVPLRHSVYRDNAGALRFYERLGFEVIEDFDTYVLMEWAGVSGPAG